MQNSFRCLFYYTLHKIVVTFFKELYSNHIINTLDLLFCKSVKIASCIGKYFVLYKILNFIIKLISIPNNTANKVLHNKFRATTKQSVKELK